MKGRTESSRARAGPAESRVGTPILRGLERQHFHYELLQKQNEALGARIALKFKSRCLTPLRLGKPWWKCRIRRARFETLEKGWGRGGQEGKESKLPHPAL